MSRAVQGKARKGSQYRLQLLVNQQPERINRPVRATLDLSASAPIEWPSPVATPSAGTGNL